MSHMFTEDLSQVFTVTPFILAKKLETTQMGYKLWHIHIVKYYSRVKTELVICNMNESHKQIY